MNKKELIEKINNLSYTLTFNTPRINREIVIDLIEQLEEEKEKVTLPRSVANWISCVRGQNKTLHFALENAPEEVNLWFCEDEKNRQNIFADAWINGYTVVKEKRYLVKMKGIDTNFNFLNRHRNENYWIFSNKEENTLYQTHHTRKELEDAGFGWVFDCEGIEIKEVE